LTIDMIVQNTRRNTVKCRNMFRCFTATAVRSTVICVILRIQNERML